MALVFVPPIGFRPADTRTLRERVATTVDATELSVVALAAAPSRTDVIVEWNRTGNPAVCPPQSRILAHSNRTAGEWARGGDRDQHRHSARDRGDTTLLSREPQRDRRRRCDQLSIPAS